MKPADRKGFKVPTLTIDATDAKRPCVRLTMEPPASLGHAVVGVALLLLMNGAVNPMAERLMKSQNAGARAGSAKIAAKPAATGSVRSSSRSSRRSIR